MKKSRDYYNTLYQALAVKPIHNKTDNEYLLKLYFMCNESNALEIWRGKEGNKDDFRLYNIYLDLIKEFDFNFKKFKVDFDPTKTMGYDE